MRYLRNVSLISDVIREARGLWICTANCIKEISESPLLQANLEEDLSSPCEYSRFAGGDEPIAFRRRNCHLRTRRKRLLSPQRKTLALSCRRQTRIIGIIRPIGAHFPPASYFPDSRAIRDRADRSFKRAHEECTNNTSAKLYTQKYSRAPCASVNITL